MEKKTLRKYRVFKQLYLNPITLRFKMRSEKDQKRIINELNNILNRK